MHCVVVGAGYVGVTSAVVLAERGHTVHLVDIDESRAQRLASGEVPFVEPGVDAALKGLLASGRLTVGTDTERAVPSAGLVLLCVGTPSTPKGDLDMRQITAASKGIGAALRQHSSAPMVVVKSTVPPGTLLEEVVPNLERASRKKEGAGFHAASNPEFLREGRALEDARRPDRIIVGALRPEVAIQVADTWGGTEAPRILTDPTTAELIKYASNAFLATKISFANEMAQLSADLGVDVYEVMRGVGLDKRIGAEFLRAGAGFGGSCFPKDVRALDRFARRRKAPLHLPRAVLDINDAQPLRVVELAERATGGLAGKHVALLGLAFKPDTDDVRESRAIAIYHALVARGAKVTAWDPAATANFARAIGGRVDSKPTLREALQNQEVAIIQAEWREIRELPARDWAILMRGNLVVDGRRSVDPAALEAQGLRYVAIGWPNKF